MSFVDVQHPGDGTEPAGIGDPAAYLGQRPDRATRERASRPS
jgi:hypothetical protein